MIQTRGMIPGNAFIDLCGQLARTTHQAGRAKPKETVELLHEFVKSQLKRPRAKHAWQR